MPTYVYQCNNCGGAAIERDAHPLFYVRAALEQDRKLTARATAKFLDRSCI